MLRRHLYSRYSLSDYGRREEYRNVHLQCESLYEKCPNVLQLNQSPEKVALLQESMGQNLVLQIVSMESPKDEYGFYLALVPYFGRQILYQHILLDRLSQTRT